MEPETIRIIKKNVIQHIFLIIDDVTRWEASALGGVYLSQAN